MRSNFAKAKSVGSNAYTRPDVSDQTRETGVVEAPDAILADTSRTVIPGFTVSLAHCRF